jgi:hypothetical protein
MVEPKVEPAAEGPVEPEPAEAIADATPPPQRNPALALAWMASVLLLLGLFGAGWLYREEIAVAWPPAQRVLVLIEPARG